MIRYSPWLQRLPISRHRICHRNQQPVSIILSFTASRLQLRIMSSKKPSESCSVDANSSQSFHPKKVAVIGAGAAGLAAARELDREGHDVTVFERGSCVGGLWTYDPSTEEDDPLGLDPNRKVVTSSLYQSLRTNLPREIMGFHQYAFGYFPGRDPRRFPGHREVALYLQSFSDHFKLHRFIRFETQVVHVTMERDYHGKVVVWNVKYKAADDDNVFGIQEERYDAVVLCNGHHTQPRIAPIKGLSKWPGIQIHSHNYRVPDPFKDQVVIVVGNASSGSDISLELAMVAKEVHLSARSIASTGVKNVQGSWKIIMHPVIESLFEDGRVRFQDGNTVVADAIVHCTGYCYEFSFLETDGIVTVDNNCVGPLYQHVFPPALAPSLSFVGLPWKVLPFIIFEMQSRWIAKLLSEKVSLPSESDMLEAVTIFYDEFMANGGRKHQIHMLGDKQFPYVDWLCDQCGCVRVEQWRKEIYLATSENRTAQLETYRDRWKDHYWHEMALLDLSSRHGYGS